MSKSKLRGQIGITPTVSTRGSSQHSYPLFNRKFEKAALTNILNSTIQGRTVFNQGRNMSANRTAGNSMI